jgi:hypothetical protein
MDLPHERLSFFTCPDLRHLANGSAGDSAQVFRDRVLVSLGIHY